MICDTNWCCVCDNAISPQSDSLYCSESCLRQDASMYDSISTSASDTFIKQNAYGACTTVSESSKSNLEPSLPRFIRRKSSIPSLYYNQNNQITVTTPPSSNSAFFSQCIPVSSLTPSLSSSVSSSFSITDTSNQMYEEHPMASFYHPKPQNSSYSILVERLNRAIIDL